MPVYKLIIEYNGTPFGGWQIQNNAPTVQENIQKALGIILRSPHTIQGASRTDAGVHALGQAAHLKTDINIVPHQLARGITAICRPNIAVVNATIVSDDFNARFDTKGKHYRYTVLNRSSDSPLLDNTSWHVPQTINIQLVKEAANMLIGEHDFAGFRAADCERENTIRHITSIEIKQPLEHIIEIHVKGTAFLKNMVRIIAGTLVDIGRSQLRPDAVTTILNSKKRQDAGQTAPAKGLTLMEVYY